MTYCTLYGGKGGVGKTTCAAATGLALAESGQETLVVSTDPAHSLADAYETELGPEPVAVAPGLDAVEVDASVRADRYEAMARAFAAELRSAGISLEDDEVERLFGTGAPAGSDEIAALDLLVEYVEAGEWDRIVLDTAPTGHTLRLLELPAVLGLGLQTLSSLRGQVRRIGESAKRVVLGPMYYATGDRGETTDDLEELRQRLERARELLTDPERAEFRVVLVPESMAVAETERLVASLREGGLPRGPLVVNRVLDDANEDCERCQRRQDRHRRQLERIRERFPELEIVTIPETDEVADGRDRLGRVADRLPA